MSVKDDPNYRLVYSSDQGRIRHEPEKMSVPQGDGIVRVRREVKGRGGKTVSTVNGVQLPHDKLKELATQLKKRCGTGGTVKDGVIEIQGDHVSLLIEELSKRGYQVKRAGG